VAAEPTADQLARYSRDRAAAVAEVGRLAAAVKARAGQEGRDRMGAGLSRLSVPELAGLLTAALGLLAGQAQPDRPPADAGIGRFIADMKARAGQDGQYQAEADMARLLSLLGSPELADLLTAALFLLAAGPGPAALPADLPRPGDVPR